MHYIYPKWHFRTTRFSNNRLSQDQTLTSYFLSTEVNYQFLRADIMLSHKMGIEHQRFHRDWVEQTESMMFVLLLFTATIHSA